MNVANLYDRLNERERVSALVLALVRGDELETQLPVPEQRFESAAAHGHVRQAADSEVCNTLAD